MAEVDSGDGVRVRGHLTQALPTPHVPHAHRFIERAGGLECDVQVRRGIGLGSGLATSLTGAACVAHQQVAIGVEAAAEDVIGVAVKGPQRLACLGILTE